MPGRYVDKQVTDLAARDCLEMVDDRVDMPTVNKGRRGLDDRPRLPNELAKASRR